MIFLLTAYGIWSAACVVALVQGLLLGLNTWEHRRFAYGRRNDVRPSLQTCRVALLAPCKGLDLELESNLRHLLCQDYEHYEVIFIVESSSDPAVPVIQQLTRQLSRIPSRIIVAGQATSTGQKIHNLTTAIQQLTADVEILAFVDSDVCPNPEWLGRLVTRLHRPGSGTVTGYRWFVPTNASLANSLLYSINASIAALLGTGGQYIVWGGSWAIRRADFDALKIVDSWQGTISDDLVATVAIKAARLPIEFEPCCMTASPMNYSAAGFASFLRRQHLIGRLYAPTIWYRLLGLMLISTVALVGAIGLISYELLTEARWPVWPCVFLLSWYTLQVFRGCLRRDLARIYVRNWSRPIALAAWFDVFGGPLALLYNTLTMCSAYFGSRIVWRGIVYDLDRQGRLQRIQQPPPIRVKSERSLIEQGSTALGDVEQRAVEQSASRPTTPKYAPPTDRKLRFDPPISPPPFGSARSDRPTTSRGPQPRPHD